MAEAPGVNPLTVNCTFAAFAGSLLMTSKLSDESLARFVAYTDSSVLLLLAETTLSPPRAKNDINFIAWYVGNFSTNVELQVMTLDEQLLSTEDSIP